MTSQEATLCAVYDTPTGHALVYNILSNNKPSIEPHNYQLEGICKVLDGADVLATMATGRGKTGFYSFLMIVLLALSENKSLQLQVGDEVIPDNPCMLLVSPTKALEQDMAKNIIGFGLKVLVINSDTCASARDQKRDLWIEARKEPTIIVLSPEELQNNHFSVLLSNPTFLNRVYVYGIDELHLLHWWGKSFQSAFRQIGLVRHRLPLRHGRPIHLIGTTATLRTGKIQNDICHSLGLKPGGYHLIRRSNMRYDIQLIFRQAQSGIGGKSFPELEWVLRSGRNTVIFCKTIALGFRLASYLWRRAESMLEFTEVEERIRLFNSLNWPSYNEETLGFLNNDSDAAVTIATDVLSIGWDSPNTLDAIIFGEPDDVDEFVQKIGRVGRHTQEGSNPRGILYYTQNSLAVARDVLNRNADNPDLSNSTIYVHTPAIPKDKENRGMDVSIAHLLLAPCKPEKLDQLYNNPRDDIPCTCKTCTVRPPAQRPQTCNCSGCQPDIIPKLSNVSDLVDNTSASSKAVRRPRAKRGEGITKEMREFGISELEKLRLRLFRDTAHSFVDIGFLPPIAFLSDTSIKEIIDQLYSIQNTEDVSHLLRPNEFLDSADCHLQVFQVCMQLRDEFAKQRVEMAQKKKEQNAGPTGDLPQLDVNDLLNDNLEVNEAGSGDGEIRIQLPKIKLRINARLDS